MTCKDCIHYDVCENYLNYLDKTIQGKAGFLKIHKKNCPYQKEKLKYIELPCKVGGTVYAHCKAVNQIIPYEIDDVHIDKEQTRYFATAFDIYYNEFLDEIEFFENQIGQTVFLTKEEAEAKLKKLQND